MMDWLRSVVFWSFLVLTIFRSFGLRLEALASASASRFWPRPGLDLVVLLSNRAFFVQKSCKIRGILLIFSGNNLKIICC